jgi:hypothetical protein
MTTTNENGAVSWGAVIAGAVGAAALSLVLFLLGTGLGLAVVSPWASERVSGTAASVSTIVWVTFVQLLASVLGGYLAGRLRTRWVTVHTNEVYFRDTAHGFLRMGSGHAAHGDIVVIRDRHRRRDHRQSRRRSREICGRHGRCGRGLCGDFR